MGGRLNGPFVAGALLLQLGGSIVLLWQVRLLLGKQLTRRWKGVIMGWWWAMQEGWRGRWCGKRGVERRRRRRRRRESERDGCEGRRVA